MEPETGYLLSEGVRQCVAFDVTNYLIRILGCPAIMLPQHEYVTCDPVGADGDELRCGVAELKCVLSGVGSGRLCERTGTKWTQIQALPWLPGRYFVGFVAPTSTANADYNFGFVIKEETD
ncbi:hypothetical protein NW768_002393 [Fusarium equiseti]|uniref:Uncharacterized protein n=1 Tax=Fusarium equiseti TaxID=61235 RepID=A0ABQ8RNA5_FUSEQ|nr:hypothetical protein NW768_002393 [Fusarium equiseti]